MDIWIPIKKPIRNIKLLVKAFYGIFFYILFEHDLAF